MSPRRARVPLRRALSLWLAVGAACALVACGGEGPPHATLAGLPAVEHALVVDYPADGTIVPPEFPPPLFLWHDDAGFAQPEGVVDRWRVRVFFEDGGPVAEIVTDAPPPPRGPIDADALGPTNRLYEPTPYQASARSWRPPVAFWETLKRRSVAAPATVVIEGVRSAAPGASLSRGRVRLSTSRDPVGAPIFYRDVPLMPARGEQGRIKPLRPNAVPLIGWRLRDVGRTDSRLLLTGMPTCANCHSFSADGRTLGIDVDGPDGDKGAYALAPLEEATQIRAEHVISWNDFAEKPPGHKTIGFLSQVSPDGRYAVTTLNEEVYIANFLDYRFLQVFFPTRGILGWYDRTTGTMQALPGAADPAFVHCDPAWTPNGRHLVFARARARDAYEPGRPLATHANDPNEVQIQYDLMRMPFDGGRGGVAVPVEGASANGMSNTFPKVSPDGRWIVFVQCRNGQLMRPDGRLWIVPFEGGEAREMRCNLPVMNSWHSFSPNGRWMVFSSKSNTPYTQMFLTHLDEDGQDSPALLIEGATASNRAVNIPEFVNIPYDGLRSIEVPAVSHRLDMQRGVDLLEIGDFDGAFAAFESAMQKSPDFSRAYADLGRLLSERGKLGEALRFYRAALARAPDDPAAHLDVGFALALQGDTAGAERAYREALRLDPEHLLANNNLGFALLQRGRWSEALPYLERAVARDPAFVRGRKNLGFVLLKLQRLEAAAEQYEAAVAHAPDDAVAHSSLSHVRLLQGRTAEGLEHLRRVIEIDGRDLHSLEVLAWHRATSPEDAVRDGEEAVALARRALVLRGRRTSLLLDVLAAGQAEAGHFAEAVRTAREALALAAKDDAAAVAGIRARLALYEAGQAYRSPPRTN